MHKHFMQINMTKSPLINIIDHSDKMPASFHFGGQSEGGDVDPSRYIRTHIAMTHVCRKAYNIERFRNKTAILMCSLKPQNEFLVTFIRSFTFSLRFTCRNWHDNC
jgi:hypothetical protein